MIETLILYINTAILTLDIFQEQKGLCEIIERQEGDKVVSFPAIYCDNGEYKSVDDFDKFNGLVYHRLTGEITEDTIESTTGCETNVKKTYPIRTVAVVKKDVLKRKNDNNYIDDKLASNLSNVIVKTSVKSLMTSLSAENVEISVSKYNTNRYEIWNEEHKNIDMAIDFDYAYVAIDYNIIVEGSTSCFDIFDCDTSLVLAELCPEITEIDGGSLALGDDQFVSINGLLEGGSL